jgi:hypothetical protein
MMNSCATVKIEQNYDELMCYVVFMDFISST